MKKKKKMAHIKEEKKTQRKNVTYDTQINRGDSGFYVFLSKVLIVDQYQPISQINCNTCFA